MKTKKKSFYQSRIETLKTQNEAEFETFKELLSPAAYEKLKKAQSSLPPVKSYCQNMRESSTLRSKLDLLERRNQKPYAKIESRPAHIIMLAKKEEPIETYEEIGQSTAKHAEVKVIPYESIETFENEGELQGVLGKIEKGAEKSQLALTMKLKSGAFQVESKELDLLNGSSLEEQDSFDLWEPKVELLESEGNAQFESNLVKQPGLEKIEKDSKDSLELPISYVSVVELKKESEGTEFSGQPQIIQLSADSEEGMYELIEVKSTLEDPLSYLPVDQHSNYFVLN